MCADRDVVVVCSDEQPEYATADSRPEKTAVRTCAHS
jgi:hypothetical protein